MPTSGITRSELIKWGGPTVFNQALAIVNAGDVVEAEYDDEKLEIRGRIMKGDNWAMPLSLQLMRDERVKSNCPCRMNKEYGQICPHVVALGIAILIKDEEERQRKMRLEAPARPSAARPATHARPPQSDRQAPPSPPAPPAEKFVEVPMQPKFSAYVSGSRAAVSIELDAVYGEIELPVCSVQADRTVYLPDPSDPDVRFVRSMQAERDAVKFLANMGFVSEYQGGNLKLFMRKPHDILNFLGAGLPELRRHAWHVTLSDRLMKTTDSLPSIVPVVAIRDAPNGDFDVSYQFDAMGSDISPVMVQAALNRNDAYIKLGDDRYVLLDTTAIKAMHAVFSDCNARQDKAGSGWMRISGVHAPYVKSSLDILDSSIDIDDTAAERWRKTAAQRNRVDGDARFEPIALGALDKVLRPYQKQGVYWMRFLESSGLCGLLADEMGLGKTLQTLTWLSLPRVEAGPHLPSLIVCPTSLVRNWEAEAKKFIPSMKTLVISGPDRASDFAKIPSADLVITSYALVQRDFEAAYFDKEFAVVALDEAQHIKNRQTKNARAVKLIKSIRRLVLTGTPVENSVSDVWSIFDFLMPGYLGDYENFKLDYELPILDGGADAASALSRLKRKLHPFILRRVKKAVAKDLPDKIVKVSYCPLTDEAHSQYLQAQAKMRTEVGTILREKGLAKSRFDILARLMQLRKLASAGKLEAFREQLDDAIAGGHRILVFSQFVKTLQLIAASLQEAGIEFCYLDGSTKNRLGECEKFNHTRSIKVFLISLMAGGTGLNLTGADMVIHYDPWWNPAVEDQATDRAHRIGQTRNVYVVKMIASNTIEEKVLELQRRKQAVISATVSTTDAAVMEKLTVQDLEALLKD